MEVLFGIDQSINQSDTEAGPGFRTEIRIKTRQAAEAGFRMDLVRSTAKALVWRYGQQTVRLADMHSDTTRIGKLAGSRSCLCRSRAWHRLTQLLCSEASSVHDIHGHSGLACWGSHGELGMMAIRHVGRRHMDDGGGGD